MSTEEILVKTMAWIIFRGCKCDGICKCGRKEIVTELAEELKRY